VRAFPEKASFNAFHSLMRPRNQPAETALSLTLTLSLRLSAPVRASPLQGFGRIEDRQCSKESTGLLRRPSTVYPRSLSASS
jgi:hypothetical protein